MDHLFDTEKMTKTIRKAKRRATWKIILITLIVLIIAFAVGKKGNDKLSDFFASWERNVFDNRQKISGTTNFIGVRSNFNGFLGGETQYKTYKWIEGKIVPTGEGRYGYGVGAEHVMPRGSGYAAAFFQSYDEKSAEHVSYTELGYREMVFFYPFGQYQKMRNDLALLPEIRDDKVMEMALSFNRGFSVQEALDKLPKDVRTTWLWVKDVDEALTEDYTGKTFSTNAGGKQTKGNPYLLLRPAQTAYGFSLFDYNNQPIDNAAEQFVGAINQGTQLHFDMKRKLAWQFVQAVSGNMDANKARQEEYRRLAQKIGGTDGLAVNDLVIYGAIVTGDKQQLASLKGLDFIKASSLGVIVDKY
ncbi:anti-sigma factor C-terminal domain-containing protein [Lysinibacillus piscis]|uniref:Sigma factor regulator C-terminal domain-containing protein n=1 Tax=Lysinibacillus piscis TaxID=2518931 RepID=A0ABQ5NPN6_9BACI|nr:anti-sigma factor C-terminal domain-containing protein [Lysinibacillus sp. KH24]GLC90309.1 hypothetical protein LYSBPC_34360 [Lysinibacillus sp. KH24]